MTNYVFVHGAWHGGWCWHRVIAGLRRASHRALAPDLAALGCDRTPPQSVTLALWAEQIATLVAAQPEPVVLVGHSLGGIVLSEVAERVPDRVRTLVYVTAFLLDDGRCVREEATLDGESLIGPAMQIAPDRRTASIRLDAVRDALYGQCSDSDVVLAQSLLVPEPLAPLATPVKVSASGFGRVPRVYIECAEDRAITLGAQRRMQGVLPCVRRETLPSDHSPFFSHPEALTRILTSL